MLDPRRVKIRPTPADVSAQLARQLGISEVLGTLLSQRGLLDAASAQAFLRDEADQVCADPWLLRDMRKAVEVLIQARQAGDPVFIHGDYDVDGVCSTVLLYESLRDLGFSVSYHVPNRFTEGYGVSLQAVENAAASGSRVLLTCDCGSSSHQALETAYSLGMRVIVTDHHALPAQLPPADAFLNPHLLDCPYPHKAICGTTVAYKLMCALYEQLGQEWPRHHLDLVAMATIADVMPLLDENRAMVRTGLRRLALLERPGTLALAQISGLEEGPWGSFAVGFGLGPRINAAGRLEHAGLAVRLLLSHDPEECRQLASQLNHLNVQRREIEARMRNEVETRLLDSPQLLDLGVIVEGGEDWHQGVVGITAGRLVERFGVPAFIMGRVGETYKGSARSPENVDLHEAMQLCPDVFIKFGGHARAAGFTVAADRVDEMRTRLAAAIAQVRSGDAPIHVDLELDLTQANLELARQLKMLEPIGEGNRAPIFLARRVRFDQLKTMGKASEHLRCRLMQGNAQRKAVAFRLGRERDLILDKHLYYDVLFEVEEESWEGNSYATLRIQSILEAEPQVAELLRRQAGAAALGRWIDGRNVMSRRAYLEALIERNPQALLVVHDAAQAEKVQSVLPLLPLNIATYEQLVRQPECPDVVLLYPPSYAEQLNARVVDQAERVHVLFSGRELRQEQQRQEQTWLDRKRLEGIWRSLKRHSREGRIENQAFSSIEEDIRSLQASPQSLHQAVEVFEELELVERNPSFWILRTSGGRRLEDSRRYQEMCRGRERFLQLLERFDDRHLRLGECSVGA